VTRTSPDILPAVPVEVLPHAGAASRPGALSPQDLGELMAAFNDVTSKLQRSHEKLHGEVARLSRELDDANALIERSRRLAALGEMAAGIAHEVRNPLGSIRLYARMLEQDLPENGESQNVARKIARSVTAIEQIVGDVLAFAREHRLQRHAVDLADLVDRAIEACAPQVHPVWRSVTIRRGKIEAARWIHADAGLLGQALVNVVRNAFEAMESAPPPGDGHTLSVSVEDRPRVPGQMAALAIVVQDSGPGVTPDVVARMFNPFFTTRSAGTGLGLSIVHRIIDAHGGMVRVRNNRDVVGAGAAAPGACVELVLPAIDHDHNASEVRVGESSSQKVESIRA
jgi:signal transduction histidine kinase